MYATNPSQAAYAPMPTRAPGYLQPTAVVAAPPTAAPSALGRDVFVPSTTYAAATAYPSAAPTYTAPADSVTVPKILTLEDIPGTPERMKKLTKQVMAPYFESISMALRYDPQVSRALAYGVQTDAEKLQLVERVKQIVSGLYNLPPITTQVLDEPWVGGGYSFDQNLLYSITTGLLKDATAGDLVYLTVHEMTHAFQHRMVSLPIRPGGDLGELTETWRGNTPQSHGYISYSDPSNFEAYAEQPLEFAAFLAGNFAEYQLTGGNNRLWGTNETEAWDLYS